MKAKKGKVQTLQCGTNMLVEHEDSNSKHYSNFDFPVNCTLMTNEEIDLEFNKINLTKDQKIEILSKVPGFARSQSMVINGIHYRRNLFKYEKL
jgi:hypothetical protein